MQAHYIYSPQRADQVEVRHQRGPACRLHSLEELVRLWAHEALRLFEDRLVTEEEKDWCQEAVDRIAHQCFKSVTTKTVLKRPILFSTYLTKSYQSADMEELRKYIIAKLRTFNEEEYSIQLVVFDSVVDHIVRIDRVLRQPIGHLLLVGSSGVGKTTLSRFVSWMNGLSVFQIKAGRNYSLADFDANLREVMKRAGCKGEKITFIFDESNVLSVSFMERMNALLASGEIPGLFDGDEYTMLVNTFKENQASKRIQTDEEIYHAFTKNVQRNLHIVFTMNPAGGDFSNRAASSPAIFNRCVIDWFGDWSEEALYQVARELTERIEIGRNSLDDYDGSPQDILVRLVVKIHNSVRNLNEQLRKGAKRFNYLTPRDFLDFIKHLTLLQAEKSSLLVEQERHLKNGLDKLKETEASVFELDQSLEQFKVELDAKNKEANAKMELITREVTVAEQKEASLKDLSGKLEVKKAEIERRSEIVQKDLDKAGPALEAAKKAVGSISSKEVNDIRVLNNPPALIKLTMQAICFVLKGADPEKWGDIQSIMRSKDFISDILNLNIDHVKDSVKVAVQKKYIQSKEWVIANIMKSYQAAGILAEWLESQLSYNEILKNVDPMRQEIAKLQAELTELERQQQANKENLQLTTATIEKYKNDYTELIAKVENIKSEMEKVNSKVRKSKNLLGNLSSEKVRWSESSQGFSNQLASMTGDVLLCAAFLAYGGFFDQLYRNLLVRTWKDYLRASKLRFKEDMLISAYLSTPSEKMLWQAARLPNDDLCSENAIIIKRHNRYPLVIDPSFQALAFLLEFYADKKIEKTSFDEPSFMKVLEKSSAVRPAQCSSRTWRRSSPCSTRCSTRRWCGRAGATWSGWATRRSTSTSPSGCS
jgi:dynein heavy chain 1